MWIGVGQAVLKDKKEAIGSNSTEHQKADQLSTTELEGP